MNRRMRYRSIIWYRRLSRVLLYAFLGAAVGAGGVLIAISHAWRPVGIASFALIAASIIAAWIAGLARTWMLLRYPPQYPRHRGLG
jgi:sulfite exporter TauE/SafE